MPIAKLAFVDLETLGLHADLHPIWEAAVIIRTFDNDSPTSPYTDEEYKWFLPVSMENADPKALEIGKFYERYAAPISMFGDEDVLRTFVRDFMKLTAGKVHLVGAVPSFDEERLRRLIWRFGEESDWHYHLIDIETLAIGYLRGQGCPAPPLPWKSHALSEAIGIQVDRFREHEALEDCRWARAVYDTVMGNEVVYPD